MNTSLTAYTHLESLLLFQSLHAYGVGPPVFSSISELLKNNPHIAADKRFQSGRLSPDALRNFYLHILKEEIRSERQDGPSDPLPPNGEVKGSRKRKAPSPSLPTTQEAAQHAHLIPKLVTKLYTRYRSAITEQIRDEEDRYERLQSELQGVERGDWDQQLQERANTKNPASRSPSLPKKSPLLPQKLLPRTPSPQPTRDGCMGLDSPPPNGHTPAEPAAVGRLRPDGPAHKEEDAKSDTSISRAPPSDAQTTSEQSAKANQDTSLLATQNGQVQGNLDSTVSDQAETHPQTTSSAPGSQPQAEQYDGAAQGTYTPPLSTQPDQNSTIIPTTSLIPPNGQTQYELNSSTAGDAFALISPNGQPETDQKTKATLKKATRKKKTTSESRATPSMPSTPQPSQTPLQPSAPPSTFQPSQHGYSGTSPYVHRSPYPPSVQNPQAQIPQTTSPSTAPRTGPQSIPLPTSPRPSNQAYSPHTQSSAPPPQALNGNGVSQYAPLPGAHAQFSPTRRLSGPLPPGSQSPGTERNVHAYPGQPAYPPQQHPMGQSPSQGGVMLPPFQVSPQHPSRAHQQPSMPHYPQVSTPVNPKQPPPAASSSRSDVQQVHPLVSQARHSISTPSNLRTPNSGTLTPRSVKTPWKDSAKHTHYPVIDRPVPLPLDDLDEFVPESAKQNPPKAKVSRKSRAKRTKEKELEHEQEKERELEREPKPEPEPDPALEQADEPAPEMETRQGRNRRKAPAKRTRLGSKASSQTGGSTLERSRSPSILSHTDTVTADGESQAGYQVKSEPGLATDVIDEDLLATPTQPWTRRRGAAPSLKRKRNVREPSPVESEEPPATSTLRTVVAPRQFQKMCSALMDDVTSHKHSSIFTTAVKARDAEGYYDIVKRPTDLKSIGKAIAVGGKVVAAAATDTPVGSPGGGGSVVELPMSLDNIPPKAIVNSSQLEKELMRMFVNAVMFNAGEEGIVEDARQMFETVQQSVSKWRSIKQSSGRLEVEETPPVQEEDVPVTTTKRRKL